MGGMRTRVPQCSLERWGSIGDCLCFWLHPREPLIVDATTRKAQFLAVAERVHGISKASLADLGSSAFTT
jgi:hypothetical protein